MKNKIAIGSMALMCAWVCQACTMAQMRISKPFRATVEEMPVDRPAWTGSFVNETYRFGEFVASKIDKGWQTTREIKVFFFEKKKSRQKFSFLFSDPSGSQWENRCVVQEGHERVGSFYVDRSHTLRCALFIGGVQTSTLMELSSAMSWPPDERTGWISIGEEKVKIRMSRELENSGFRTGFATGYYFYQDATQLGAVDVLNQGKVYLKNGLQPELRRSLAAVSVALMVFERL